MFSEQVRETAIRRLKAGESYAVVAREMNIAAQTIFSWRRRFCVASRKNLPVRRAAQPLVDWSYPSPRNEALACVGIAARNGGIEAMRKLISVSDRERLALMRLVQEGQLPKYRVETALAFRARVLEEFDRLVNRSQKCERGTTAVRSAI